VKLWLAIYHHRHGTMAFPLWCEDEYTPTERDAMSLLDEFEPGERVDIDGPGMGIPDAPHFGAVSDRPEFVFARTGSHAAVVIAHSNAGALKGLALLAQHLGRKLVSTGPSYKRVVGHWQATVYMNPDEQLPDEQLPEQRATAPEHGVRCDCVHGAACHDPATGACLYTNPIHGPCPCAATPPLTRKALRTAHETLRDVLNEQANRR
jgi:hypothetical protein